MVSAVALKQEDPGFKLKYFFEEFPFSPQACIYPGFSHFPNQHYAQLIGLNIWIWALVMHVSLPNMAICLNCNFRIRPMNKSSDSMIIDITAPDFQLDSETSRIAR